MQALPVGFGVPDVEGFAHGGALFLEGEVDDGGGASDGGGLGAGGVVVGGGGAAEGHVEMGVDVDAAGEDEEVCGVDHGVVGGGDVWGYCGDLFVFDEDVGALGAVGVDYGSVLDQRCHLLPRGSGLLELDKVAPKPQDPVEDHCIHKAVHDAADYVEIAMDTGDGQHSCRANNATHEKDETQRVMT